MDPEGQTQRRPQEQRQERARGGFVAARGAGQVEDTAAARAVAYLVVEELPLDKPQHKAGFPCSHVAQED